mmetsp:Transcript_17102/g.22186  ORF Transcript_17102/g.22186 Transcript_17102/m.22186 type:complete len:432 (-) Transcript_17102:303-1598(-)
MIEPVNDHKPENLEEVFGIITPQRSKEEEDKDDEKGEEIKGDRDVDEEDDNDRSLELEEGFDSFNPSSESLSLSKSFTFQSGDHGNFTQDGSAAFSFKDCEGSHNNSSGDIGNSEAAISHNTQRSTDSIVEREWNFISNSQRFDKGENSSVDLLSQSIISKSISEGNEEDEYRRNSKSESETSSPPRDNEGMLAARKRNNFRGSGSGDSKDNTSGEEEEEDKFQNDIDALSQILKNDHKLRMNIPLSMGKSQEDGVPVNFHIINNSHFHIEIGWINYAGSIVVRRVLPPDLAHFEVSHSTHPWIITTMELSEEKKTFGSSTGDFGLIEPEETDESIIVRLGVDAAQSGNRGGYNFIWQPLHKTINLSQKPTQSKLAQPSNLAVKNDSASDSSTRVRNARMNLIKQIRSLKNDPTGTGIIPTITLTVMTSED